MIIGISGKIGAGKDEVGKIIQYLTYKGMYSKDRGMAYQGFIENYNAFEPNFQIKKFADTLKNIVCLLLNCTREQLEDREFKDKELGEEWVKWRVTSMCDNTCFYYSTIEEAEYSLTENGSNGLNVDPTISEIKPTPRLLLQLIGTECGKDIIHPNI